MGCAVRRQFALWPHAPDCSHALLRGVQAGQRNRRSKGVNLMTQKNEFLIKLKDLLKEYDVSIGFNCSDCSDTHGIYDAHMIIYQNKSPWKTIFKTGGWELSSEDI